ncbi:PREDICTED: 60S acidic ribosomal protein P1-like [Tarenaya hassleriana]|uniref:60S acidic ribosomal protein P1-like n=1 Tax=Tarenaya hassleriana TaxID=28532 RepID=UPI00053C82E5|nr:PREDICTED: 60S acidic ribosomal protein P1-like [Tarenaya hassleriana]
MATGELACTYAALILHDEGIHVTAEKISALVKAANLSVESYWPSLFAKLCEKKNIDDLIMNVGSGGVAGPMIYLFSFIEEPKEESDDDMGFSLFD